MTAIEPAQLIVIGSLVVLAIELIRGKREPALLFAAVVLLYLALGLVDMPTVLADLSNPGLATVVLLVMLSTVLDKARVLDGIVGALVDGRYRWALLKLGPAVAAYSAFLNNTAVVASLIGPLQRSGHHSPSRTLLPACYAASLGGVLTLVGTSTNLLVSGFLVGSGRPALSMFDTLPVGAAALAAGVLAMVLAHPWLLPDHADLVRAREAGPALQRFVDRRKEAAAVAGFALAIVLGATGVVDFTLALLVLLVLFLAARFTSVAELRRGFPVALVTVIGGALVVSSVMARTGTADLLAAAVMAPFEGGGDRGAVASVLLLAWVLTELMTNNAAAALALPIAVAVAERHGLAVMPMAMAVLFGASASFLTPHGYQTNLMVMGPGRYTTGDFLRAGTPVAVAYLLAVWITIPLFFPLRAA